MPQIIYIYHDLWFEQLPKKKECNETWCRAPAGIRTESPRNCTTVQPWTEYSSSSRWRSLRLKYQPGSRIGSWSAGISTPCSLATCHVQTHRHWVQTAARAHSYEINPLKLPCDTLRQRERDQCRDPLYYFKIKITLCRNSLIFSPSLLV